LLTPANATLLAGSAVADFECAYADFAVASGLVADELADAQLSQAVWDYDRRTLSANSPLVDQTCANSTQGPGVWVPLSTARFDGDQLLGLLGGWTNAQVPNRVQLMGQTAAYTGYALTLMGETMCAGAVDGGPKLTPDSLLGLADAHFGVAITNAAAANDPASLNMAYLGRARERLDRGQAANAAADAQKVPPGFLQVATYDASSTRRENRVYTVMWRDFFFTVDLPFRDFMTGGVLDSRVVVDSLYNNGKPVLGPDNATPIWATTKFPAISSPIAIAHYSEAQLIIAEADNDAGNPGAAVNIINAVRIAADTLLPPYTGSLNKDSVQAAIVHERAAEFFLEGHRLGDFIRYKLPLNPPAGAPFKDGGNYGTQLCFPLPVIENGT
jgi:starch-binding outer membrane protein, SusD/RagB family